MNEKKMSRVFESAIMNTFLKKDSEIMQNVIIY